MALFDDLRETRFPVGMDKIRQESRDTLWLKMEPRYPIFNTAARNNFVASDAVQEPTLWFLMPNQYSYPISHTWGDFISPMSVMRGLGAKFGQQAKSIKNVGGQIAGETGANISEGNKADNPTLYEDTARREIKLTFEFSVNRDTYHDVFAPIHKIIKWTCPSFDFDGKGISSVRRQESIIDAARSISGNLSSSTGSSFQFPYVFNLSTVTGDGQSVQMINIKNMGVQSILPTFNGPWINGYPSYATLDIDFIDLEPLYKDRLHFEDSRRITASIKGAASSRTQLQQVFDRIEQGRNAYRNNRNTIESTIDRTNRAKNNLTFDEISRRIRRR